MRRHLGVSPIDLGIVETCLEDSGLPVVGDERLRHSVDRLERAHMGVDPIGRRLRPGRACECEAERSERIP